MRKERVACYIRVSSQEQKLHGYSIAAQKEKLQTYADQHNLIIHDWYCDEGVSGRKLIRNRPELQRMIIDGEHHLYDRIIFIKLDRFFRSVAEYHEAMKRLSGITWTATEEKYDLSTATGRTFVNMKLAIAEMEADQTGERINLVNEYKVKTGQPLTGNVPFGWHAVGERGNKKVVIDPEREEIVRFAVDTYMLTGSLRGTLLRINAQFGMAWSINSLKLLLHNPMLCGSYRDNEQYCEAYYSREEFDKLQDLLKRNIKSWPAKTRHYYFSGLIVCPDCGRRWSGYPNHGKSHGKPLIYNRYRCKNHVATHNCSCGATISENVLERKLLAIIEDEMKNAEAKSYELESAEAHRVNMADLNARLERLNYSWEMGRISVEDYDRKYAEIQELMKPAQIKQDFTELKKIFESGWKDKYNALDSEHKQQFWHGILRSIQLTPDGKFDCVEFL